MLAGEGVEQLREQLFDALGTATELADLEEQGVDTEIIPQHFRSAIWDLLQQLPDKRSYRNEQINRYKKGI